MNHSILSNYISFITIHIRYERLELTYDYIFVRYCIFVEPAYIGNYRIRVGTRWEFISLNLNTNIITMRSPKGIRRQFDIYTRLI